MTVVAGPQKARGALPTTAPLAYLYWRNRRELHNRRDYSRHSTDGGVAGWTPLSGVSLSDLAAGHLQGPA